MLQSRLLAETVSLAASDRVLILNSAADPFLTQTIQRVTSGTITLAEDNVATIAALVPVLQASSHIQHVAFHDYILHYPAGTMDVAVMNLLYQPSNAWMHYGLQVALYALRPGGRLYVVGAKDRGILSIEKRMREVFGHVETLQISKGQRALCSQKSTQKSINIQQSVPESLARLSELPLLQVFAGNKLDEGTRLLLEVLEVRATDVALDLGCGAGTIGLYIAQQATQGRVTMVDASLTAVAVAQRAVEQSQLTNVLVLPSDGAQAVLDQRFDLVATNPPFHQGGIQTTAIAERFIRQAAQVLRPQGRFYLVANRFLKYEPTLRACFKTLEEVGGDTRYKVLRARFPI